MLAGCATPVQQVRLDASTLGGVQVASENRCGFRLRELVDARVGGVDAGGLGPFQLKVEDGPALMRAELLKAGLLPAEADGRDVIVSLKQLYMSENRETTVPVVVYSVQAEGMAPFVVRAQPTRFNWTGSDDALLEGISRAVHEANLQLMQTLNRSCTG